VPGSSIPAPTGTPRAKRSPRIQAGAPVGAQDLGRRIGVAADELTRLAAATDTPSESDRLLAETFSKLKRMGRALRSQSEALAVERRRTRALRVELRRLRRESGARESGTQEPGSGG
jgi:hypothetical protein